MEIITRCIGLVCVFCDNNLRCSGKLGYVIFSILVLAKFPIKTIKKTEKREKIVG